MEIRHRKQRSSTSFAKRSVIVVNFANHENRQQYNKGVQKVEIFFQIMILQSYFAAIRIFSAFRFSGQENSLPSTFPPTISEKFHHSHLIRSDGPSLLEALISRSQVLRKTRKPARRTAETEICVGGGWLGQNRRHKNYME